MAKPATVPAYIASVPPKARRALRQIRRAIREAAPGITEGISYRIAVFKLDGQYLLYMAGFANHVSIYPVTRGMVGKYSRQLTPYRAGAATLRFDLEEPLPLGLIGKLARVRIEERQQAAKVRRSARARSRARAR